MGVGGVDAAEGGRAAGDVTRAADGDAVGAGGEGGEG